MPRPFLLHIREIITAQPVPTGRRIRSVVFFYRAGEPLIGIVRFFVPKHPGENAVEDLAPEFKRLKALAEEAASQVNDDAFFTPLGDGDNSIAVLMKHVGGNLRSRWTDFLTTDGEKPDRHRDGEFIVDGAENRASIVEQWERGWAVLLDALGSLNADDWNKTVHIRREPHSVRQASLRCLSHMAYHVGQIVLVAKHSAGDAWQTLSIPRGDSERYNALGGSYTSGSLLKGNTQ